MFGRRAARRSPPFLLGAALFAAACGGGTDVTQPTSDPAPSEDPTAGDSVVLQLRVAGTVEGGLLCPGARRPCLPYDGDLDVGDDNLVVVTGRLLAGVFRIDEQQALPERARRSYENRCPDQEIDGPPPIDLLGTLFEGDPAQRPDGFVDAWDSDDGTFHIGVSGDATAVERWLDDAGAIDQVCVVPGFPHTDALLESVQAQVGRAATDAGFDDWSVTRDAWEGTVTLSLPRMGQQLRTRLDEISSANDNVAVQVEASVEVLSGSVDDYEAALAQAAQSPDPVAGLVARCGEVVFSDMPPDLDEFPPLDDEAQAALDGMRRARLGEAVFSGEEKWSIAKRTDTELVLFGQPASPSSADAVDVRFEKRDGAWQPTHYGGCRILIEAPGLGPATVAIDPVATPRPTDTTLSLLINERECASGQPPEDREVIVNVSEDADTVTIVALVAPVEGNADCQSNPWFPVIVELGEPLGDRQLLDGHRFPAAPVGQPD